MLKIILFLIQRFSASEILNWILLCFDDGVYTLVCSKGHKVTSTGAGMFV